MKTVDRPTSGKAAVLPGNLLWIDDQINSFQPWIKTFEEFGTNVDTADSIAAGLNKLDQNDYNVVLLDLHFRDGGLGLHKIPEIVAKAKPAKLYVCSGFLYLPGVVRQLQELELNEQMSIGIIDKTNLPFTDDEKGVREFLTALNDPVVERPDSVKNSNVTDDVSLAGLIGRLRDHEKHDGLSPSDYEQLCRRVITCLFEPDLYGFESQVATTDGANRYDFACRIRPGNPFWDGMRMDFKTRSILFECKNYSAPITAEQIYSTERYLFSGALRMVCFVISRKGPDEKCKRAAEGALRESGKLILLLSNNDLIEMLKLKADGKDPTSYIDHRIWTFTTKLPR